MCSSDLAVGEQHPILLRITSAIISYREARKATGTYFNFKQYKGRLLYSLNPFGTESGRLASSESHMWCGTQIQNFPVYAKYQLMADKGFLLVENDNSKSEAHCVSVISGDETMMKTLRSERDFYKQLGTLMFGIPFEEVSEEFRNKMLKKINHGVSYVMGATTMIENATAAEMLKGAARLNVKITMNKVPKEGEKTLKQFASDCIEAWHKPFPKVREWYKTLIARIAATHMTESALGFTRYFFGNINKDHNIQKSAIAHEPQNLSVSILNIGFYKVYNLMKRPENRGKLRLKCQIHDSILYQRVEDIEEGKRIDAEVLKAMSNNIEVNGIPLIIPVDAGKPTVHWKEETL